MIYRMLQNLNGRWTHCLLLWNIHTSSSPRPRSRSWNTNRESFLNSVSLFAWKIFRFHEDKVAERMIDASMQSLESSSLLGINHRYFRDSWYQISHKNLTSVQQLILLNPFLICFVFLKIFSEFIYSNKTKRWLSMGTFLMSTRDNLGCVQAMDCQECSKTDCFRIRSWNFLQYWDFTACRTFLKPQEEESKENPFLRRTFYS